MGAARSSLRNPKGTGRSVRGERCGKHRRSSVLGQSGQSPSDGGLLSFERRLKKDHDGGL